jgi:MFS family permease
MKSDFVIPKEEGDNYPSPGQPAAALPERSAGYFELLRRNPNFRNFWGAQLISAAGDWFNNVALLGLVLELTNSGFASGMVLLTTSLPFFLLIPLTGPIVDRFSRKKVMMLANLVGAVMALSFLLVRESSSLWLLFVGSILLVSSAAFFNPASSAIVPTIVTNRELYSANALSGATWGVMVMVGSALGGLVSVVFGREVVFILNSLSFLLGIFLIWRIKMPAQALAEAQENQIAIRYSTWGNFKAGVAYLGKHRRVIRLVALKSGWNTAGGVLVLLSVFGDQVFKAGDGGIGLLYAGRGLGALLGPFLIRPLAGSDRAKMRRVIVMGFIIQAVGYTIFAGSTGVGLWLAVLSLVLAHLGGGINWTGSSILLQEIVPDQYRGRVFAIDLGFSSLTLTVSTLVWSVALQVGIAPAWLALAGAAVFLSFGLAWNAWTRKISFEPEQ